MGAGNGAAEKTAQKNVEERDENDDEKASDAADAEPFAERGEFLSGRVERRGGKSLGMGGGRHEKTSEEKRKGGGDALLFRERRRKRALFDAEFLEQLGILPQRAVLGLQFLQTSQNLVAGEAGSGKFVCPSLIQRGEKGVNFVVFGVGEGADDAAHFIFPLLGQLVLDVAHVLGAALREFVAEGVVHDFFKIVGHGS